MTLHHLKAPLLGQFDHRLTGQSVEKTVGRRGMDDPIAHHEDVGAGGLGHIAAIVEHQGVGIAFALGGMFGHGADHVKTRRLGLNRCRIGRRTAELGAAKTDALGLFFGLEIARPFPSRDGDVDLARLSRHAHHFGPAPSNGADIAVGQAVALANFDRGRIDLFHREGDFEIEQFGRTEQALGMFGQQIDLAAIHALTFEHGRAIVQAVGEYVYLCLAPGHKFPIQPDPAVAIIKRHKRHCSSNSEKDLWD